MTAKTLDKNDAGGVVARVVVNDDLLIMKFLIEMMLFSIMLPMM